MLYYVQPGDSLFKIARRFNTSINAILTANVICNPNLIFVGLPLIIPEPGLELPKAGGRPYYVILPGDTLWCLARQFNTSVATLTTANQIQDPSLIYAGSELLIAPEIPNPTELKQTWQRIGDMYCNMINPLMEHGIYYIGSFQWEALGQKAIPYLLDLLQHPCNIVRFYTLISLGRLAINQPTIIQAIDNIIREDPESYIKEIAKLVLRRIKLVQNQGERIHITTTPNLLLSEPNFESPRITIDKGTEIIVLRWYIPSPSGEIGPRGDIQLYDQIMILSTGQTGFIPRFGYNEITLI